MPKTWGVGGAAVEKLDTCFGCPVVCGACLASVFWPVRAENRRVCVRGRQCDLSRRGGGNAASHRRRRGAWSCFARAPGRGRGESGQRGIEAADPGEATRCRLTRLVSQRPRYGRIHRGDPTKPLPPESSCVLVRRRGRDMLVTGVPEPSPRGGGARGSRVGSFHGKVGNRKRPRVARLASCSPGARRRMLRGPSVLRLLLASPGPPVLLENLPRVLIQYYWLAP